MDADLGNYSDDYVECDVKRNLGVCYNGDDNDEGILGYGINPPSVGVNFFQGPIKYANCSDTAGVELGLSKFIYYNNDWSITGNPQRPEHYWNYLNGRWKDGLAITYGGNGRGGSDTASFMFPGKTDPAGRADWTERIAGNTPGDRRFLQTAGPFSLCPGAVNQVTVAVVWARATTGGATGSFNLLKEASDKASVLYKNHFKLIDGPGIPDLEIVELDKEIILNIKNYNKTESYIDSTAGLCSSKTIFKFQGYMIYQLKKNSIPSDLYNLDEAKLVAQCDLADGYAFLVNQVNDADLGTVKKIMVNGEDKGIRHSFKLTKDYFSTFSDPTLVNFQSYYYLLVSYSNAQNCVVDAMQYLAGRKMANVDPNSTELGIKVYTATPHNPTPHNQGTVLGSKYGDGPEITKVRGIGNSGIAVRLSLATIEKALLSPYYVTNPVYEKGKGPINVKITNPYKVPLADFELRMTDFSSSAVKYDTLYSDSTVWTLKNLNTGEVIPSETKLINPNEQLFPQWGLSITLNQVKKAGYPDDPYDNSNGFISSSIEYADKTNPWLPGIPDEIGSMVPFNWIRSGNGGTPDFKNPYENDFNDPATKRAVDPRKQYAKIVNGTWAPYALTARAMGATNMTYGPGWAVGSDVPSNNYGAGGFSTDNPLGDLHSIEFVLTQDQSKWSRCVVLEAGENPATTIGGALKLNRRKSPSLGINGKPDGQGNGLSWFPGYAVDVETGERLNILFAEDSSLPLDNGNDMLWNPTSNLIKGTAGGLEYTLGGKHHIYVMGAKQFKLGAVVKYTGPRYDSCRSYNALFDLIEAGSSVAINKRYIFSQAMWVSMTAVLPNMKFGAPNDGYIPCNVKIRINVKRPFAALNANGDTSNINKSMPVYTFSTAGLAESVATKEAGKSALDLVSITPNPYYAYAGYEDPGNQLDTKIKIINLPTKCVVSIYTQGGFLVRRIKKDDNTKTYLDWNLKNDANVPISSGVYLIHIYADGIGERVIKWFGVMRTVDFDTF